MKFLMNNIYSCVNQRNYNVDFFFFVAISFIWCLLYLLCATETASLISSAAADTQFVFDFDVYWWFL